MNSPSSSVAIFLDECRQVGYRLHNLAQYDQRVSPSSKDFISSFLFTSFDPWIQRKNSACNSFEDLFRDFPEDVLPKLRTLIDVEKQAGNCFCQSVHNNRHCSCFDSDTYFVNVCEQLFTNFGSKIRQGIDGREPVSLQILASRKLTSLPVRKHYNLDSAHFKCHPKSLHVDFNLFMPVGVLFYEGLR